MTSPTSSASHDKAANQPVLTQGFIAEVAERAARGLVQQYADQIEGAVLPEEIFASHGQLADIAHVFPNGAAGISESFISRTPARDVLALAIFMQAIFVRAGSSVVATQNDDGHKNGIDPLSLIQAVAWELAHAKRGKYPLALVQHGHDTHLTQVPEHPGKGSIRAGVASPVVLRIVPNAHAA